MRTGVMCPKGIICQYVNRNRDMSAAFDTVDHDVLVTRLVQRFGVTGCAIAWINLADRSQSVNINCGAYMDTPLTFGVPQG